MAVNLFECLTLSEGRPLRVDREAGIIYGVKALGWDSLNGRRYLPEGVDPKLYEGKKVCRDHVRPGQSRSSNDTIGVLEGTSKEPTGIFAARFRLFNPRGEFELRLMGAAEHAPHAFGLSHTARGREKPGSNGTVIEAVESVATVDIVDDPATVAGLYESRNHSRNQKVKTLTEWVADLEGSRPLYARALREMAEAGLMSPDADMAPPPEEAEAGDGDHETALKAGFRSAIIACLDDESMDLQATMKRIKEILKTEEKLLGGNGNGGESEEEPPAEESRRRGEVANLREELGRLKSCERVRAAADAAGVRVPKTILENLAPDISEAKAKQIVAELRGTTAAQRPRSASPRQPAQTAGAGRGRSVSESTEAPPTERVKTGRWLNGR
jgi:hypothetical protein